MTEPERPRLDFEPPWPALAAGLIFLVAGLTLCWPIFTGQFLAGPESDQFIAGYSFRHFAAEYHRQFGAVPQWNPYLFGGMPFVGAAHGDIFYPTAWLRWFLPTDVAMSLGFAVHIVLAGCFMYGLLRTLGLSWAGAVVGGLAYEMTGIVISLVHPGHDGKLFVSAAAPLLFSGIVWAVRDRRTIGYAVVALATGLALQGHPQTTQYLLVAGALWGAFWLFGAEGPKGTSDKVRVMAGSVGALALGIGLYAIYALPMAAYVPFSPRAAGGANTGWEHAIQFSLPASELVGVLLPKIYGGMTNYFGPNGLRLHSEYLGPVILLLAAMGLGGPDRRTARRAFVAIGVVFLLVSLGGSTPFFRIWYAIIPLTSRLRAPGQAFFLVAMALAFFAAIGAERLLRGAASKRRIAGATITLGVFGLLAAAGLLQLVSEDMARSPGYQGFIEAAIANASALQADGGRLLLVTAVVGALALALIRFRLPSWAGLGLLLVATWIDPWVIGREYFVFSPPARVTYAADPVIQRIQATKLPYRVFGPEGGYARLNPYRRSWLMSAGIPTMFGYHGNELRTWDDLLGGKNGWENQLNPNLWKLLAVRFVVLTEPQNLPGFRQILGPEKTFFGTAYLYEADTVPPYARVYAGAAKVPEAQLVPTLSDRRFPIEQLALYADTTSVSPAPLDNSGPAASALRAEVVEWRAGKMTVAVTGTSPGSEYLVVAENWYPSWRATIDGKPAPVLRAQNTLLSVVLPPGAKEVILEFDGAEYHRGKLISMLSVLGVLALFAAPALARRKPRDA